MKARPEALARRYARALLDVVSLKGDPAALQEELDGTTGLLTAQADLRIALEHPAVAVEKKRAVLEALFRQTSPSPLLQRLLHLLAERHRIEILGPIARAFTREWNVRRGVVEAEAVSARPLEESERLSLATAVERVTGHQVALEARVDPHLVGGLLLRMEGKVYDGSVRARLRALKAKMAGRAAESQGV